MEQNRETIAQRLARVEEVIGGIEPKQHGLLAECLLEDEPGVLRLAAECATSQFARNPVAVFVSALRKGRHRTSAGSAPRRPSPPTLVVSGEQRAKYRFLEAEWRKIGQALAVSRPLSELFIELQAECSGARVYDHGDGTRHVEFDEFHPSNAEGERVRRALVYAIEHPEVLV